MSILTFVKGPCASEDSIYTEYQFLILPCYFSSGFEKQQGFIWFLRLSGHQTFSSVNVFGNMSNNDLVHYKEESKDGE